MSAVTRAVYNSRARPEQTPICFHMETTVTTANIGPQVFLPMGSRGRLGQKLESRPGLQSAKEASQSARGVYIGKSPASDVVRIFSNVSQCARGRETQQKRVLTCATSLSCRDEAVQDREQVVIQRTSVFPSASEDSLLAKILKMLWSALARTIQPLSDMQGVHISGLCFNIICRDLASWAGVEIVLSVPIILHY